MDDGDRLALHELPGRYGDLIDDQDWAGLATIFTEDATFEINGRLLSTLTGIRHYMAHVAHHPLAHLMVNVYVDERADDVVLHSRVITLRPEGAVGTGRYRDEVVKRPDGWRVRRRVFVSTKS